MKKPDPFLSFFAWLFLVILLTSCTGKSENKNVAPSAAGDLKIGWATADITPDKPVLLSGQFHARVSEGVRDPISATALAMESGNEKAILITCDLVSINDNLRDEIRKQLKGRLPEVKPEQILINATHTHTAPLVNTDSTAKSFYGVELEAMPPASCLEYISERVAKAAEQAWKERQPGGISFGLGQAVVGHNRLKVDMNGKSAMYGKTNTPDFSHLEGFEDHSVNLLYTWNAQEELTGVVINLSCPSQVSERDYLVSADYWHDTRLELRKRLGERLFILPQISAAGDQSPHIMVGDKAEERMQRLMVADSVNTGRNSMGQRRQIALKISDAVTSVLPYMKNVIEWNPEFAHRTENIQLSRRLIGMQDVNSALKESEEYSKQYQKMLLDIENDPAAKQKKNWYFDITRTFTLTKRGNSVRERYELEKKQPKMPVEVHVLRIGDMVMATNPFELYLDYGIRIKGRSPAVQTFIVQLTGGGSYLPVARSVAGGSYGAVPASTLIGPEGGQELVEKTLEIINSLWK